ncbi:MAG: gamma carbonic anhydrase family protein [Lachnospiraceae bacterium]|nr:gamma carbonic anhydrase family protein [Lachnospiraceae bacterium]MBR2995376.1 gamma carbonic anhydrase family protein [Lachnospiraceae bacterium]
MKHQTIHLHESAFLAPGAVAVGDVEIGENASVWYNATLRGDSPLRIGARTNIQDNAVLHAEPGHEVHVGEDVSIGHGAIVHGCRVGSNTLIGMGAIILNDAVIGSNCLIGAGALVTQGKVIPDGSLVIGSPAVVKRALNEEEIAAIRENAVEYLRLMKEYKEA